MKVVIDTNVVVSAVLRDKDPEAVILWIAAQPDWDWVASPEILAEYTSVLSREKFSLPADILEDWIRLFDRLLTIVKIDLKMEFSRDRKDASFLACALAVQADYFITGDRDFEEAQKLIQTIILPVSTFKRLIVADS